MYFWTFTFPDKIPLWQAFQRWNGFLKALVSLAEEKGSYLQGVRVVEAHKTHGYHFHALINCRLHVRDVRELSAVHGIGRDRVKWIEKPGPVIRYLSKYLSKEFRDEVGMYRTWRTINFDGCKVQNSHVDTIGSRLYQQFKRVYGRPPNAGEREILFSLSNRHRTFPSAMEAILWHCKSSGASLQICHWWGWREINAAFQFDVDDTPYEVLQGTLRRIFEPRPPPDMIPF